MTDHDDNRTARHDPAPERFVVPGGESYLEEPSDVELAEEAQRMRDLGSASRSCVAILAVLLVMALLICVFLIWAFAMG